MLSIKLVLYKQTVIFVTVTAHFLFDNLPTTYAPYQDASDWRSLIYITSALAGMSVYQVMASG